MVNEKEEVFIISKDGAGHLEVVAMPKVLVDRMIELFCTYEALDKKLGASLAKLTVEMVDDVIDTWEDGWSETKVDDD